MSNKKAICQNFIQIVTVGSSSRVKIDTPIFTGNVGIGTSSPRVALDIFSTDAILVPVGTEQQRPSTLVKGLLRYNTTEDIFEGYSGSSWKSFSSSANTMRIMSVLATNDGWTVTTDNGVTNDDFQVHVTPAIGYDSPKAIPVFISATGITTSPTTWPYGSGWSITTNVGTGWHAFNIDTLGSVGDKTTSWITNTNGSNNKRVVNDYIIVKYPYANKLSSVKIRIANRESNRVPVDTSSSYPDTFYIDGSHDNVSWVRVQIFASTAAAGWAFNVPRTFNITNPHVPYKYWRLYIYTNSAAYKYIYFNHISFNSILSNGRLSSAYSLTKTDFKIVMTDRFGAPLDMRFWPVPLRYNIMITKGESVVLSGLYQFKADNSVDKIS
jgi:hypothetical protein